MPGALCVSLGIPAPTAGEQAHVCGALPLAIFGGNAIRAVFKPWPIRILLRALDLLTELLLLSLGWRQLVQELPSWRLAVWTDLPRGGRRDCAGRSPPPVVLLHGVGVGKTSCLSLCLGASTRGWRSGGCILVDLLNMTSRWSNLEGAPVVAQTAFALGKILREQLGIGEQQFDVVAHSLGSALAVAMSNAGSPYRPRRTVLIEPVCFWEGWDHNLRLPFFSESESENFISTTTVFARSPSWVKASRRAWSSCDEEMSGESARMGARARFEGGSGGAKPRVGSFPAWLGTSSPALAARAGACGSATRSGRPGTSCETRGACQC